MTAADATQATTIFMLAMYAVGIATGAGVLKGAQFFRRLGTILVIQLDRSTHLFSMEYRRPKDNDMTIQRGKTKGTVMLEGAQVFDPVPKEEWQKRGGNGRARMMMVDGEQAVPLQLKDWTSEQLEAPSGWEVKKWMESRIVKDFINDGNSLPVMALLIGILFLVLILVAGFAYVASTGIKVAGGLSHG